METEKNKIFCICLQEQEKIEVTSSSVPQRCQKTRVSKIQLHHEDWLLLITQINPFSL